MDYERLLQLNSLFSNEIERNHLKDVSISVQHKGKNVFTNYYGQARQNSIFKIYSMSKPITATAVMILLERGLIDLNDDISWYLPRMKKENLSVLELGTSGSSTNYALGLHDDKSGEESIDSQSSSTYLRPVENPITIRQLLNMTSGLCYPDRDPVGMYVIQVQEEIRRRIAEGELFDNLEIAQMLGTTPLLFEPGSDWKYGTSADILGAMVEAVSGMQFGDFLKQNIFEPLAMSDTWFSVPTEKLNRLIKPVSRKSDGHLESVTPEDMDWLGQSHPDREVDFQSGGGYLYSTLEDYSKFADMLVNGGTTSSANISTGGIPGVRILGRKTVEFMSKNQLTPEQLKSYWLWNEGYGYANLMRTMIHPEKTGCGTPGEFGWDGLAGTYFLIDPKEELAVVYMQQIKEGGDPILRRKFRNIIYSAL